MLVKQVVAVMLVSSLACNAAQAACFVKRVKTNSVKQARTLIRRYDDASEGKKKLCKEQEMRDLLLKLKVESDDFGGTVKDEAMSGELIASNVNLNEKVALDASIKLLQDKLASIDAEKPSAQKRRASQAAPEPKEVNKRRQVTN